MTIMRTMEVLPLASELYSLDARSVRLIRSCEFSPNDVYCFEMEGRPYILRIATHGADHLEMTAAEMEWLAFLSGHGVRVSMPLPMRDGRLAASVQLRGAHHAICAFEKAGGAHARPEDAETWNDQVARNWGRAMGGMHRATKDYRPVHRRGAFDGGDVLAGARLVPQDIAKMIEELMGVLLARPKTPDNYGLIHSDFHQGNFFVERGEINIFDFDDSQYGHFALDMGIALYHALRWGLPDCARERQGAAERVVRAFLGGYRQENALAAQEFRLVVRFMKYRQLSDYVSIYRPGESELPEEQWNLRNGVVIPGCHLEPGWFAEA